MLWPPLRVRFLYGTQYFNNIRPRFQAAHDVMTTITPLLVPQVIWGIIKCVYVGP